VSAKYATAMADKYDSKNHIYLAKTVVWKNLTD
jgi:hypothetical protein